MTTAAVKKMMLSTFDTALRENDGVITGDEYKKIIDYAKRGWLTSGEKRALLEPSSYIGTKFSSEELRRIKFD